MEAIWFAALRHAPAAAAPLRAPAIAAAASRGGGGLAAAAAPPRRRAAPAALAAAPPPSPHRAAPAGRRDAERPARCRAEEPGAAPPGGGAAGPEGALALAETVLALFAVRDPEGVVPFVSDAAVDDAARLARRRAPAGAPAEPEQPRWADVLRLASAAGSFQGDAYASRLLVYSYPAEHRVLSTLSLDEERCLVRAYVRAASGEEAILVLAIHLEDGLEARYRGLRLARRWALAGVCGEPGADDHPPERPGVAHGPEAVVRAQLDALQRRDVRAAWAFAAPANRAAFGDDLAAFADVLRGETYGPLLGHAESEVLKSEMLGAAGGGARSGGEGEEARAEAKCVVVVGVTAAPAPDARPGAPPERSVFIWTLGAQAAGAGPEAGCWCVESVLRMSAGGLGSWSS
jgi:hypothetical protein